MYAVFRTGGKQFRAEPGKKIRVPSLGVEPGESITFEDILLASDGSQVQVGENAKIAVSTENLHFFDIEGRQAIWD